jgi:hypothetical protein
MKNMAKAKKTNNKNEMCLNEQKFISEHSLAFFSSGCFNKYSVKTTDDTTARTESTNEMNSQFVLLGS